MDVWREGQVSRTRWAPELVSYHIYLNSPFEATTIPGGLGNRFVLNAVSERNIWNGQSKGDKNWVSHVGKKNCNTLKVDEDNHDCHEYDHLFDVNYI